MPLSVPFRRFAFGIFFYQCITHHAPFLSSFQASSPEFRALKRRAPDFSLTVLETSSCISLVAVLQAFHNAARRCTTLTSPPISVHPLRARRSSLTFELCITSSPFPTSRQSRHAPLHNISNCGQHGSRSPLSSHSFTCKPHPGGSRGEALLPPSVRSRVKRSPALPALPSFSAYELCR